MTSFLERFRAQIIQEPLAKPSRFIVTFHPPAKLNDLILDEHGEYDVGYAGEITISMFCQDFVFPSQSLATVESRYIGNQRKIPYLKTYEDLTGIFFCSEDLKEFRFFKAWQDLAIGPNHDIGYYDDYIGSIDVAKLSSRAGEDGNEVATYITTINDVYPLTVSSIPLSYGNTNDISRCTVLFDWRDGGDWKTQEN